MRGRRQSLLHDAAGLLGVVVVMAVLGAAAYTRPFKTEIAMGGGYDRPYLDGFNNDPEGTLDNSGRFRWAFGNAAIRLPGAGRALYLFSLRVVRSGPREVASRWSLAGHPLTNLPIVPASREYTLVLPPADGDLLLQIDTPTFQAGSDPRRLAFAAADVAVTSLGSTTPAVPYLLMALLLVAALYALLRLSGVAVAFVVPLAMAGAVVLAVLFGWQRLVLTTAEARWLAVLLAALPVTALLWLCLRGLSAALIPLARAEARPIAGLIVIAWVIRMLALVHPQAITSDAGLHLHNLESVATGRVIFTEGLPARAGGGQAPYPPAGYLALLPAGLLLPSDTLITAGTALIDSLTIAGLWCLARLGGLAPRVALFAGVLYLVARPALASLGIGEMENILGQTLALPLAVALLAYGEGRIGAFAVAGWAALALLGHFGVFLSCLAFAGVFAGWRLLARVPRTWPLVGSLAAAALFVVVVYYSVYTAIIVDRPPAPVGSTSGFGRVAAQLISTNLLRDIGLVPMLLGLAGLVCLWRWRPVLARLATAWWLAGLLSLAPLLWSQQALRWQLWLVSFVALCGGCALHALWQRGKAGPPLALALTIVCVGDGLWHWIGQIATYLH